MPATPTPPTTFDLTLDEFCMRASTLGQTVEMLAGFHSDETRQGHVKDSEAAFSKRLEAFAKRPA